MKYIKRALLETSAWWMISIELLITTIALAVNALILTWISNAVNAPTVELAIPWVIRITVGCVVNTAISGATGILGISKRVMYTWLYNTFINRLLDGDAELYEHFSPGTINHNAGKMWRMANVVETVINMVKYVLTIITNLVAVVLIAGVMGAPVILAFILGAIALARMNKTWKALDEESDNTKKIRNNLADEMVNGFMEVRSFPGTTDWFRSEIVGLNDHVMDVCRKRQRATMWLNIIIETGDTVAMMILIGWVLWRLSAGNPMIPATAVTLIMYSWRIAGPFVGLVFDASALSEAAAVIPGFVEVMDHPNRVLDGHCRLESFDSDITLTDVDFGYDRSSLVLQGVTMTIPKGANIGICGETGQGKSTLLKLIPRFYDVTAGAIRIDGLDVRTLTQESIREHIGMVHQSPFIFDGTLAENIAFARKPHPVSETAIVEAAKKARLHDFIMSLPDGYETKVGPRGMKLSGGQRQRLSLARVFIHDPDIILLDEATSALDNETEELVQEAIGALKGKTIITVAHRLSTIRDCDRIYVIAGHRIAESGTHAELLAAGGIYADMLR